MRVYRPGRIRETVRLPLFPLQAVLFPGATLPLHIFEPRYREMIGRCLEHDEPFGVCLILEGEEVGGPAVPHRVGTEAAIIASQRYPDGRYDIVVEGRRRFEIVRLVETHPVLLADVRFVEERDGADDGALAEAVAKLFEGVLENLELSGQAIIDETWKAMDARSLSYKIAAALPVEEDVKQEVLELEDTDSRLRRIAEVLMHVHRIGAEAGAS